MTLQTAIITGGGTGVGRAVATTLAGRGFAVVLAGRRRRALEDAVGAIQAAGGEALAQTADVTDEEDVRALFALTVERFGRVDLLFNNAGLGPPQVPLEDLDIAAWRRVIDTNLTGAFLCVREAFRVMKTPRPNSSPYTASKHGMAGLTKAASLDGRKYGIAVGQIDIGNTASDMALSATTGVRQANGQIAVEPLMDATSVADAVAFMAGLPLSANTQFLTLLPTQMPFIGRG